MKYDANLEEAKKVLSSAQNILIALPKEINIDNLASGLALYLSLSQFGKNVSIVTEGIIKVEHSNLFGVGKIKNNLPEGTSGDFIITLAGVANPDGTVPAADKADYFPSGSDLNVVIKVKPGQTFTPTSVTTRYSSGGADLIFVIGATTLADLGSIYTNNSGTFSGTLINIDNHSNNTNFGSTNIVDQMAASLSEIMGLIIPGLGLPYEGDTATNILDGIFKATDNLQSPKVGADTYEAVAQAVRVGGKRPSITPSVTSIPQDGSVFSSVPFGPLPAQTSSTPDFDLSKVFNTDSFTVPPVVSTSPEVKTDNHPSFSSEEKPTGEAATTESPEADWLTPKIYKGSSIG